MSKFFFIKTDKENSFVDKMKIITFIKKKKYSIFI